MEMGMGDFGIAERLGRRKLREKRSQSLGTKLTLDEEKELERAAAQCGQTGSEWAREVLLREARRAKEDALFTEVVAIRTLLNYMLRPLALGEAMTLEGYTAILNGVRERKRETAQQVMAQYTHEQEKER